MRLRLMPMKRTERLGETSPGTPGWNRPTTPCFLSPVRSSRLEDLSSSSGNLSDGTNGRPRHVKNGEPNRLTVGGGTPRLVHSRPKAASAAGVAEQKGG